MRLDCGGRGMRDGSMQGGREKERARETPPRNPDLVPLGHKATVVTVVMREKGKESTILLSVVVTAFLSRHRIH